jgi:hypothetical protein
MRALVAALALLGSAVFAAVPVFEATPAAQACSCPDCDAVRDSEVIVGGRIAQWRESAPSESVFEAFVAIEVPLHVDRVFKGAAPADLLMRDVASLQRGSHQPTWIGAAGACGAFDEDPSWKYIIIGFDSGSWGTNRLRVLYFGAEPAGSQYAGVVQALTASLGPPHPPAAGDSAPNTQPSRSNDWMFVSAIGAGSLLITLVLLLAGPKREPRDGSLHGSSNRPGPD